MLTLLHIENIAVVERADVEFGTQFNVLTGETGAGKSIIIDAINAVLGERTSRDIIRSGESSASVSAVFAPLSASVMGWLSENDYEPDEDGTLLIQRSIYADGRNVCKLNGRPVTVSLLRGLGTLLINIHGQHDSQQLLDDSSHMLYLDSFAKNEELRQNYAEAFNALRMVRHDIEKLTAGEADKARKIEMLRFRVEEIDAASLYDGEDEELELRRDVLRNSERITEGILESYAALYGGEDYDGACSMLVSAERELSGIANVDETLAALHSRISELRYAVDDVADELRALRDAYEFSPEEADRLETRLDLMRRLKRKYGATVAEVLEAGEAAKVELDEIEFSEEKLESLRKNLALALAKSTELADALTENRKTAATALTKRILTELSDLDMKNVNMAVELSAKELSPDGADSVRFLISANAGEELRPLAKVASGGELARIMLAMKSVLSENDEVGTLIFDEVDAGVSGRAAQRVAEKLTDVGAIRQVLCVTHLPQIAAMSDDHYLIEKREERGRTFTSVLPLDGKGRAGELARMTGGAEITETTLKNAEELIKSAEKFKIRRMER